MNESNTPAKVASNAKLGQVPERDIAHSWRVRFALPDGFYTFTDIRSTSGLPMPKAAACAWGLQEVAKNPKLYASVASVYSIDHEA